MSRIPALRVALAAALMVCTGRAQPVQPTPSLEGPQFAQTGTTPGVPVTLNLAGAVERARNYNQQYLQAYIASGLANEDRLQARAAFFPTLTALSQYIYTQGNGTPSGVFISNDGVHVYNDQLVAHAEVFSFAKRADYQRAIAAQAAAQARQQIAFRGLVATVAQSYYGLVIAQRHQVNARRSLEEARQFLDITQKQERGGEVARADVIKAQLQVEQRQRDQVDAEATVLKAKIALGILLFPDVRQLYDVGDDLSPDAPLPSLDGLRALAESNNPEVRAAEAGLKQSESAITVARAAYFPSLAVDYFYGINANRFAIRGPEDRQNLGSVVQGTATIPIWNWGATRSKVRQAELQRQQAQYDLTFSRRNLESSLNTLHLETQAAQSQLKSLRSSLDLSAESLRLTVLRYQAGEATALEVADAQGTLAAARNAYDDGLARYRTGLAGLEILTGRF